MSDPIVIVSAARTPMGGFQGDLKGLTAPQLGSAAIRAAVERAGIASDAVDEVLFGCVLRPASARPGTPGRAWRRAGQGHPLHHPQQKCAARAWRRRCLPMTRCWPAALMW